MSATVLSAVVSDAPAPPAPSGWFPDPLGRHEHRYFNGSTWTSDVADGGQRSVDPFGTTPGPAAGAGSNSAATGAVVMGSIGLALAWIPFIVVIGFVLSVLAVIFGIRGLGRARLTGNGRGAAMAGTIMGALGIAASVVGVILSVMVWNEVIAFAEPGPVRTEITSCTVDGRRVDVEGTITNLDDERHDYTLFVELGGRREIVAVDDVGIDETVEWATAITARSDDVECEPDVTVQGPFPYGIEVDPVDG
jgi:hypothetical protein